MKKIVVIDKIIEGGAILLYAQLLMKALNVRSKDYNFIFTNTSSSDEINKKNKPLIIYLKKYASPLYRLMVNLYTSIKSKAYIRYLEKLDDTHIILIPYIIQEESKLLDNLYQVISKKKFILVVHDLHAYHYPLDWKDKTRESVYNRYTLLSKFASRIIVHNNFTKNDVFEKLNYPLDKVFMVKLPPFLNNESGKLERNELNEIFNIHNIKYGIWASSSTSSHKNHENLLKAWKIIIDKGYNIKLICTGHKTPRWDVISILINDLELSNYIFFTGLITNNEVSSLIKNASFSICPTLFAGGGPVPAAESIIMNVPLLISNIQECQELLDNNLNGAYFFDPHSPIDIANQIINVLENTEMALEKAAITKANYLESRTWEKSAKDYLEVFKGCN